MPQYLSLQIVTSLHSGSLCGHLVEDQIRLWLHQQNLDKKFNQVIKKLIDGLVVSAMDFCAENVCFSPFVFK